MSLRDLGTEEGRRAFGADVANYDAGRPDYLEWVYERLQGRCGLKPGTRTFEIGPGTGLATAKLLKHGASPLVAIEPDARLAKFLRNKLGGDLQVLNATFEDVRLEQGRFDLGAAATSFHWMEQKGALSKIASALRSGGWWAAWWNVYGDPERADPFHEATKELLRNQPKSPSHYAGLPHPFALDTSARLADINAVGDFVDAGVEIRKWSITLSAKQVRGLYATFSQFSVLEPGERERLLDGLECIAKEEFAGQVVRNMRTALYTARKW
jgi:SAM-dependent methyltransferase